MRTAAVQEQGNETRRKTGVIDCDVHETFNSITELLPYLNEEWHSYITELNYTASNRFPYVQIANAGRRKDALPEDGRAAGSDYNFLAKQLLDAYDMDYAILAGSVPHYPATRPVQPMFSAALASAYNDWMINEWLVKDPRLLGTLQVTVPHNIRSAVEEIERLGDHPQIVQVMLPVLSHEGYGNEKYFPIFEAAAKHKLVIGLHQYAMTETIFGFPPTYAEWHTGFPQAFMAQATSIIFAGIPERFPELQFVMIEGGFTWMPHVMWRMDQKWRSLRAEIPWVKRPPSEYVQNHFHCTSQPIEEPSDPRHLLNILEMIGSERFLLFASDYPHWDFDDPVRSLPSVFPNDLRERVLWRNAAEVYRLNMDRE
jgi:predicted TIM-barrel fold metal-dependent hydrolase